MAGQYNTYNAKREQMLIDAMIAAGRKLTVDELKAMGFKDMPKANDVMNKIIADNPNSFQGDTRTDREKALNSYWQDVNDYGIEGTTGYNVLNRLEEGHRQQAETDQWLADAVYQQQALQQGAIVKQITDQVRNERMARLRSGMSETQIANQDMQMMMANVNAVNDQMNQYAIGSMQAQAKAKNAQALAFNDYLQWAAQGGQSAGAAYAAAAGDANAATQGYMTGTGGTNYNDAFLTTTGQKDKK